MNARELAVQTPRLAAAAKAILKRSQGMEPVTAAQLHRLLNIVRAQGTDGLVEFAERMRSRSTARSPAFWGVVRDVCAGTAPEVKDVRRKRDGSLGWEPELLERFLTVLVMEVLYRQRQGRRSNDARVPREARRQRRDRH